MFKFKPSVLFSSKAGVCKLISIDHDDLLAITGPLCQLIPLLKNGAELNELISAINGDQETTKRFLNLLYSKNFLEDSTEPFANEEFEDEVSFKNFGEVRLESFEATETIYAQYTSKSFSTGG